MLAEAGVTWRWTEAHILSRPAVCVQCPQVYQADYQLTSDLSCQADRKLGWTVLGAGKCGTLDTWAIHSTQLWSAMSQVIGLTLI